MKKFTLFFLVLILFLFISCSKDNTKNLLEIRSQKYIRFDSNKKEKYLDSLWRISSSLHNDTITRRFLFDLAGEYYFLNLSQKSFKISKKAFQLSLDAKDSIGIARSLLYIGDCYEMTRKDSAYFYYQKAEKIYRLLDNKERTARMLFNKAYILFYDGNYLESEIQVSNSLQLLKNSTDKNVVFTCYNLLASNFQKMEEYNNALKYYLLAKDILNDLEKNNKDFDGKNNNKLILSINIANVYEKQFQFDKAKNELESALTIVVKKQWPNDYAVIIGNLGYIKTKLGQFKEGEALMKEALSLSRKSGVESNVVFKLHNLGKYYFDIKDTLQATRYLKESLQLAEKLKSSDDIKVNLQLLSAIDKTNTSYYDKRYIVISDSLTKVQRKNRNKYARIEYETSVVEDANKELNSRNVYLIVGVVVLTGALGIHYVLGQRKELAHRKQLQAAELELFDLIRASQIALNEAREEEQNRISKELHDNVMNKIYGARLQLGMLNTMTSPEAEEKRSKQIDNLQTIEQDIRSIAHDLHSDVASHFDYHELLASCVRQATVTSTEFHLDCDVYIDWESISGLVKITIYRIVQEALSNVAKYAHATKCIIKISLENTSNLRLIIVDDGKGFDATIVSEGIGMKNMKARAVQLKADFNITSVLNQGTRIECRFDI